MSFMPLLLLHQADRAEDLPVAWRESRVIRWRDFVADCAGTVQKLAEREEKRWLLVCRDAYYFTVALWALAAAGKEAVVPPNFQLGTLARLSQEVDGFFVDDCPLPDGLNVPVLSVVSDLTATVLPVLFGDAIVELFTSGSTGEPKRVRKRFAQLAAEVDVLDCCWGRELQGTTVAATVPHYHIYGMLFRLLWPLSAGCAFDCMLNSNPNQLVERSRQIGALVVISSPAFLNRLPDLHDVSELTPWVKHFFSSGGPLAPGAARALAIGFGKAPTEVYGSTETGGIAWRVQCLAQDGDAWTPLPSVDLQLDVDSAIVVRSPFLGDGEAFVTADAARRLSDGRFVLLGRTDRVLKLEEKRLSLAEMEGHLKRHPWVADAAVQVLEGARRLLGVAVVLSVEGGEEMGRKGRLPTTTALRDYLAGFYEPVLLPRRWRFPDALPLNERGKLATDSLKALFLEREA